LAGFGRLLNFSGGGDNQRVSIRQIPAPELPKQSSDMKGLVTRVQDNSIYVAAVNNMQVAVVNGVQQLPPTPAGPYTEVVVSKDTKVYRDVTMENVDPPANASGEMEVQQKLELADISAINASNYVQVWGQRRGDRINAEVIVTIGLGVVKDKPEK
jgi:hypothetical protein